MSCVSYSFILIEDLWWTLDAHQAQPCAELVDVTAHTVAIVDWTQMPTGIMQLETKPQYASALVHKRLRTEGVIDHDYKVIIHQQQRHGRLVQVAYSAVPLHLWSQVIAWSQSQAYHCHPVLLPHLVWSGLKNHQLIVWHHGLRFDCWAKSDLQWMHHSVVAYSMDDTDLLSAVQSLARQIQTQFRAVSGTGVSREEGSAVWGQIEEARWLSALVHESTEPQLQMYFSQCLGLPISASDLFQSSAATAPALDRKNEVQDIAADAASPADLSLRSDMETLLGNALMGDTQGTDFPLHAQSKVVRAAIDTHPDNSLRKSVLSQLPSWFLALSATTQLRLFQSPLLSRGLDALTRVHSAIRLFMVFLIVALLAALGYSAHESWQLRDQIEQTRLQIDQGRERVNQLRTQATMPDGFKERTQILSELQSLSEKIDLPVLLADIRAASHPEQLRIVRIVGEYRPTKEPQANATTNEQQAAGQAEAEKIENRPASVWFVQVHGRTLSPDADEQRAALTKFVNSLREKNYTVALSNEGAEHAEANRGQTGTPPSDSSSFVYRLTKQASKSTGVGQ